MVQYLIIYERLQSYLKQQSPREQMNNTNTELKDIEANFGSSDPFSEKQSDYRPPSTEDKNNSVCVLSRKQKRKQRNKRLFNQSMWTLQENILYKQFLKENKKLFEPDQNRARKIMKINLLMSKYVKTRSSDQCRSHHQKIMKKNHSDVLSIIRSIEDQENGVVKEKIRREEPTPQEERISTEQPQTPRDVLMSFPPIQESENIWELFQKDMWHDYPGL